jgi:hypothetical protein
LGVNAKHGHEPPARTFNLHLTMKALRKGLGKLDAGLMGGGEMLRATSATAFVIARSEATKQSRM